ncbi:hypothetical protein [Terricaulis sp.]|uniref:hypothetical protein n=1 Tax=Terricaulis sp. TaxID=2768686 RepID=UPI00378454E4
MLVAWWVNALALAFGVVLGVRALLDPRWAAKFVRLKADEQGGGFAEFRATYGGVFAGAHVAALALSLKYVTSGSPVIGVCATGAAAVLAAAWGGAAFGRALSYWRDDTRTPFNRLSMGVEAAMALAIGVPWLLWALSKP